MADKTKSDGMAVRDVRTKSEWTFAEYGDRLFSIGGNIYGSKSEIFKLAISVACIDVLTQDVAKTDLVLRRYTDKGSKAVKPSEHKVAELLKFGPNEFMGTHEFLKMATANLAVASEYYVATRRTSGLEVTEFAGIPKANVSSVQVNTEKRKLYYQISPSTLFDQTVYGWASGMQDHKDLAHIKRRSLNGVDIIANSTAAANAISLLSSMQSQQSGQYENGGLPKVAFTFPDGLTDDQFARLKDGLQKSLKKSQKDGTPIILEGADGVVPQVHNLSETAKDQDYVKGNINAAMDVIRYFRVPPHKVFLMESIKYDNMDSVERVYVDDTLSGLFKDIEEGLSRVLLTTEERREYFIEFDKESAYAMSPEIRQKIADSRWKNGIWTKNQTLSYLGQNQIGTEGDIYMMSGNFVLTDDKNEIIMRAGGNKPDDELDENGEPKKPVDEDDEDSKKKPEKSNVVQLTG